MALKVVAKEGKAIILALPLATISLVTTANYVVI